MYLKNPSFPEINYHTIKFIVGFIALSLAALTNAFTEVPLQSISASYHEGEWSRNIFVGFLFAISAFLLAYNGKSAPQMVLSKIASFAAIGVAMFPCKCKTHTELIPGVHYISAVVMFSILAIFCFIFLRDAYKKGHFQAKIRAVVYALCGVVMIAAMMIMFIDFLLDDALSGYIERLTYYCEASALIAFGIAWLLASMTLPLVTTKNERFSLSLFSKESIKQ
ncbi:DUF998 domain-containing protein [Sulfurovum sp. zt1-1]|uniref:DUF998 domain-containing protein n=1 Tax=Sulfurovum zhangzhouensis TaxID=3019067 RepID=A0ABT7QWU8_9BACT|nr:DUF998 domain-containing protein [Sulfurovum zhangzhouensis]MDM5270801.1 DUF998 domain-containing protein [Sulfurovum zhangzhouensis]